MNRTQAVFRNILRQIISYFFQGILFTVPVAATAYILYSLFLFIDGIIPFDVPGLGFLIIVLGLILLGILGNTIIAQPIRIYFTRLIDRAPFIKTIYSAFTDLMTAFVGKKRSFNKPVLVKFTPDGMIEKPGFVTQESLEDLELGKGKVAVYFPHSYAFSGNIFIVPAISVTAIDVSSADFMKFIVSGGVAKFQLKSQKNKPNADNANA